jgi:hypothetical protein
MERVFEPLVISLDGSEPEFTTQVGGVAFDLDADGIPEQISWTIPVRAHAFVVMDLDRNGRIDSGRELIGGASGPPNGFTYLRAYDGFRTAAELKNPRLRGPKDLTLDRSDVLFERLILWMDANHDGVSQEAELQSASYAGLDRIDLQSGIILRTDGRGNVIVERSLVSRRPGNGASALAPVVTVRLGRNRP